MAAMELTSTLREHRSLVIATAATMPLVACAAMSTWRDALNSATAVLVLTLIIVAAAATGDRIVGIAAASSSAAWFDFFLTEPYYRFTITDPDDIEAAVLLVVIGLAVTEVALWGRREQARASRRAGYLDGAMSTAQAVLAGHESLDTVIDQIARQIVELLGIERCRFVAGPVYDSRFATLDHDGVVTRGDHRVNVARDGLPTDEYTALPIRRGGVTVGHFILTSASRVARPSLEQRRVAVLLADQVAARVGKGSD